MAGSELIALARRAITEYLKNSETIAVSEPAEKQGVFCTLKTKHDVLRGCIGFPYPVKPLGQAIIDAAIAAATADPRFKPVELAELDDLKIELTILTVPQELTCAKEEIPNKIEIGKHGLIVGKGAASGLLLPQVAVENGPWSSIEFLEATCWKAGLPPHAWKEEETKIFTFEGEIFEEE